MDGGHLSPHHRKEEEEHLCDEQKSLPYGRESDCRLAVGEH